MIITIDGPAASGKTTLSRMLAKKLEFYYLSSGLLFRGLAYVLLKKYGYDQEKLKHPKSSDLIDIVDPEHFVYQYDPINQEQLFFDGQNITAHLKDPEISYAASIIAMNPTARHQILKLQHRLAQNNNLIAEGRDLGSEVFPQAEVKFFLTASPEVRAARFAKDQAAKGNIFSLPQALKEIQERDERDITRSVAPLRQPKDAIVIDDSNLTHDQAIAAMMPYIQSFLIPE